MSSRSRTENLLSWEAAALRSKFLWAFLGGLEDEGTVLVDLALCCDDVRLFDGPGLGEGGVGIFVEAFGRV